MEISSKNPLIRLDNYTRHTRRAGRSDDGIPSDKRSARTAWSDEDDVLLSPRAREILEARKKLHDIPDIRSDKVAALKNLLAEDRYTIDPDRIAGNMMVEGMINSVFLQV